MCKECFGIERLQKKEGAEPKQEKKQEAKHGAKTAAKPSTKPVESRASGANRAALASYTQDDDDQRVSRFENTPLMG